MLLQPPLFGHLHWKGYTSNRALIWNAGQIELVLVSNLPPGAMRLGIINQEADHWR